MKATAFVFAFTGIVTVSAHAQSSPSEVTDAEIERYKSTAQGGCRKAGIARGDPQEKVDAVCGCVMETLSKSMSRSEWQQAYFHALKKQEAEEKKVLAAHAAKLGVCRPRSP